MKENAIKYLRKKFSEATGLHFRMIPVEEFEKDDIIRMLMLLEKNKERELDELRASRDEWVKTAFEGAKR